jgi:hypothetical protein
VRALLTEGKQIRVTSELGTDIIARIEGRPGYICAGKAEATIDLFCAAFQMARQALLLSGAQGRSGYF